MKLWRCTPVFIAAVMLLVACSPIKPGPINILPLRLLHTSEFGVLPVIPVSVSGQTQLWVVDTASTSHVIAKDLVKQLDLDVSKAARINTVSGQQLSHIHSLGSLKVGRLEWQDAKAVSADLSHLNEKDGPTITGILGMPALKGRVLWLDFLNRQAALGATGPSVDEPNISLPISLEQGVPTILTTELSSRPWVLDTGYAGALLMAPKQKAKYANTHRLPALVHQDLSGSVFAQLAVLTELKIGEHVFADIPVDLPEKHQVYSGVAGNWGNAWFSLGQLKIDLRAGFERLSGKVVQGKQWHESGVQLNRTNAIAAVLPNSPAALAGLRPGDKIIAANGQNTVNSSAHDIWQRLFLADTITLQVLRGGGSLVVKLPRGAVRPALEKPH